MLRVFAILLVVYFLGWSQRDRLPGVRDLDSSLAGEPIQTPTQRIPFDVERRGVSYHIKPLANYELRGLVVSYHDSDSFFDLSHKLWGDKLNFRDLGVVWGENALSGLYRQVSFESRDYTLYSECRDERVWRRFRMDQVSNNHILTADPEVERSLRGIGKGDQILLRGVLCRYSHPGGSRSSSLTRKDTGNGACETVFVDSVVVLEEANAGWRFLARLSSFLLKLTVPMLVWQAWTALRAKPNGGPWAASADEPPPLPFGGTPEPAVQPISL